MLKQHFPFTLAQTVERGGQHHFSVRQIQAEGGLACAGGARDMAGIPI